jgi:putative transposase
MMGAVFEGIGFDILVALAGFGNPISSAKGKFRLFFGLSGSLLTAQKLSFLRKLRFQMT